MKKEERYSWLDFEGDMQKISTWARPKNFQSVYGIPRGGLVVAVKLSHLLDIPLILRRGDITPGTLIVDDIVDRGATLNRLLSWLDKKKYCVVSIFFNKKSRFKPNYFLRKKSKNWVIFPWETRSTSRYDGTVDL